MPAWLSAAAPVDAVLTGSALRPAVSAEGEAVEAQLASASVLINVVGPEVPGEGLPYQGETTACTWTVSMSGAKGRVPVSLVGFSVRDHLGAVYRPTLAPGQPALPALLEPGRHLTFHLRAVVRTGEGVVTWSPEAGAAVASWDFVAEND